MTALILKSVLVLVAALVGFLFGSIVMVNIGGMPEPADMSGYAYLRGNIPLLLAALAVVYLVFSFGEVAIYRAFLINRLGELGSGSACALKEIWLSTQMVQV